MVQLGRRSPLKVDACNLCLLYAIVAFSPATHSSSPKKAAMAVNGEPGTSSLKRPRDHHLVRIFSIPFASFTIQESDLLVYLASSTPKTMSQGPQPPRSLGDRQGSTAAATGHQRRS